MCESGIGKIKNPIMLLRIIAQLLCNQATSCGTPTNTILVVNPSSGADGTYNQINSTTWEQVTPSADYGFRLVAGVWEVYELINPGTVWFTIPASQFPCGTWTAVAGMLPFSASYV